jgi:hypothetical protein
MGASHQAAPSSASVFVAAALIPELLRVEVIGVRGGRGAAAAGHGRETSTRRSLWGPPYPPHQISTYEGPVEPALRRFGGLEISNGGFHSREISGHGFWMGDDLMGGPMPPQK